MNILLIDKSEVFSLGLKNSILKSNVIKNINTIEISNNLKLEHTVLNHLDVLFIDYGFLECSKNLELIKKYKNYNFKIIISANLFTRIDFNLLVAIQPNGFFSKSINKFDFKMYIQKVMNQIYYIDFESINQQVKFELETNFKLTKKFQLIQSLNLINDFETQLNMNSLSNSGSTPLFC